jgi:LytS/YehU family sensor histidine kinase
MLKLENKSQLLEKEKAQVMYENLKQQLNPHFLFNSLTSLSSLIRMNPDMAGNFLESLSKTYRYILKSRDSELVPLVNEIRFAETYVRLQQTRFEKGMQVNFNISEELYHRKIAPVTLQNMIENAIKHNIIDEESPLVINIYTQDDYIIVRNNLQKKNFVETSNRQGLSNLLSLYHYLSDKKVSIEEDKDFFMVKIPLL